MINAPAFAIGAHKAIGQKRKYTGECYSGHLADVVILLQGFRPEMIAAGWLHDVVEDTAVTHLDIYRHFGGEIASLVGWLTKPQSFGTREQKHKATKELLSKAPPDAQTIKYCDIISNCRSLAEDDLEFSKIYFREKREILEVMVLGDDVLRARALEIVS